LSGFSPESIKNPVNLALSKQKLAVICRNTNFRAILFVELALTYLN